MTPIHPLVTAVRADDHRAVLVALREELARRIAEEPPARDLAALARRLIDIERELATVPTEPFDEIDAVMAGEGAS